MAEDDKFRLPKSSYEELVKIIKGYAQFDGPEGLDGVSKQIAINKTIISANVGFLIDIGVLEGGRDKQCTPKGRSLAQALMHEMPEEIRRLWGTIVNESVFLSRIVAAVRIRQGMDESTISSHIAYSAGQPKNAGVMTGSRTIVDILRAAELLREQDGKLTAVNVVTVDAGAKGDPPEKSPPQPPSEHVPSPIRSFRTVGRTDVQLSISVNIDCSAADLDTLGAKLKKVMDDFSKQVEGPLEQGGD